MGLKCVLLCLLLSVLNTPHRLYDAHHDHERHCTLFPIPGIRPGFHQIRVRLRQRQDPTSQLLCLIQ